MSPAERVREIFDAAAEMDLLRRCSYVFDESQGDVNLFHEVMSLLEASSQNRIDDEVMVPNGYRLKRILGWGAFGVVYLADDKFRREVVIKMPVSTTLILDPWVRKKFGEEVLALARIDHPGIVALHDGGTLPDGRPFFVMTFIQGKPLTKSIPTGGMPLNAVAQISTQLGDALQTAHSQGVVHRDLKPSNIMIENPASGALRVRIIDFGIAAVADRDAISGVLTRPAGTPPYMAPEQATGMKGSSVDIYAFGAVVYQMVTGQKIDTCTDSGTYQSPTPPSKYRNNLPKAAERLILQAVDPDPGRRPPNAAKMGADLAKSLRRRPIGRVALIAAVIACILLIATYLWPSSRPLLDHTVMYSILVQQIGDGRPAALIQLGQALRVEDKFQLLVRANTEGHLYIFGEEEGSDSLNVVFPSVASYRGSSLVKANELKNIPERSWLRPDPPPSVQYLWLMWSKDSIPELESLKRWVNARDKGVVGDDAERAAVRNILSIAAKGPQVSEREGSTERTVRSSSPRFALRIRM